VLAGSGWQAWRPFPLRLAEFGLTGLGDRAGDRSAICRPDEQIHLEADGCAAQRVHHGRPIGGAAVSGWHLRDRARSRPSWTSPCRRRRMRGKQIIPAPWIDEIAQNGSADAWDAGVFAPFFPGRKMHYGTSGSRILARRLAICARHSRAIRFCRPSKPACDRDDVIPGPSSRR